MERRVRGNSHARCGVGEKLEIISKTYLSPFGITRAEQRLYLTCARLRMLFGRTSQNSPSRFIREISDDIIEEVSLAKQSNQAETLPFSSSRQRRATNQRRTIGQVQSKPHVASLQTTGGNKFEWKAGDKAIHKKWGKGMVVSVRGEGNDMELDIAFPDASIGVKRLLAAFAPIEKA